MSPTDAELAQQALGGSQAAYHQLTSRYATAAVNFAARLVRDRAVAEELAQEAFLRAFDRLASYDVSRKFSSWFFQIVHNITVDYLRRSRVETVSLDVLESTGHPAADTATSAPDEQAEQTALADALDKALTAVRPEYREAILLRYREDLSHHEIAEIMRLPIGTVKTYLHRARKELADVMSGLGWGLPPEA